MLSMERSPVGAEGKVKRRERIFDLQNHEVQSNNVEISQ